MLTKKFFKQIGVLFTLLLLMVCSIPRVYAVSETSDPYKIYDSEGKLLSVVNSLEEVEAYFESELNTPETYAIDCDGLGHRHVHKSARVCHLHGENLPQHRRLSATSPAPLPPKSSAGNPTDRARRY